MRTLLLILVCTLMGVFAAGCGSVDDPVGMSREGSAGVSKSSPSLQPSLSSNETGVVTVIHGVPGLVVDVYVNGAKTLASFKPWTVTDPLSLPEGNYSIVIVPEGGDPATPAISGSAFLPAGANVSIVAHLTSAGTPTLSVFVNDVSSLRSGTGRLTVRHTAQAPAVDLRLYRGDTTSKLLGAFTDLSNPNRISSDIRPGAYTVTLSPAGTSAVVFGPVTFEVDPKRSTTFYAVGSLPDGSFRILSQTINLDYGK